MPVEIETGSNACLARQGGAEPWWPGDSRNRNARTLDLFAAAGSARDRSHCRFASAHATVLVIGNNLAESGLIVVSAGALDLVKQSSSGWAILIRLDRLSLRALHARAASQTSQRIAQASRSALCGLPELPVVWLAVAAPVWRGRFSMNLAPYLAALATSTPRPESLALRAGPGATRESMPLPQASLRPQFFSTDAHQPV
jgi:hypothetical protein